MIRSSKTSLKFSNKEKLNQLNFFLDEYKNVMIKTIDLIWDLKKIPSLLPKKLTDKLKDSWLSFRAIQSAAKQASGIVRGTRKKEKARLKQIEKFNKLGMYKKARKLQEYHDKMKVSKPKLERIEAELDSRFIKMDFENETIFDGWITINSIGLEDKIIMPIKKTKHFNKMLNKGVLKKGIRISKESITFGFELPEKQKTEGNVLGIDIGSKSILSCSDGVQITEDKDNWTLQKIAQKLSLKKRGSKSFERTIRHRDNFVNWSINQLNFSNVKQVNIEDIKNLKKGKRLRRELTHWSYREIFDSLENKLNEQGVLVVKLNPRYTSQRCSRCGWVSKDNRKKKKFKCTSCNYENDADLNASLNISLSLTELSGKALSKNASRSGFYWCLKSQEDIVPDTLKA
jgi:IS605 OrfB family transposase